MRVANSRRDPYCIYVYAYCIYVLEYTPIVRPLGLTTLFLALTFITVVPFFAGHSFGIVWVQRPSPIVTQLPESRGNKAMIYIG